MKRKEYFAAITAAMMTVSALVSVTAGAFEQTCMLKMFQYM